MILAVPDPGAMPAGMKRLLPVAVLVFLGGCSNAPVAGFLDCVAPARGGKNAPNPAPPPNPPPADPIVPDVRPPGAGGGSLPPPPGGGTPPLPQPDLGAPRP